MSADIAHISLEQAKQLVEYLENNQQEQANELIAEIQTPKNTELFAEIGKLTRQLHDSMNNFNIDSRIKGIANADIPDAKERLNYVIERTENAANKTMDAVESIFPSLDKIQEKVDKLMPQWQLLMRNEIDFAGFKELCHEIDELLNTTKTESTQIHGLMTDVLMAQDFQDLTGQVIRKVIDLVIEVEDSLIHMLTVFGLNKADENETNYAPKVGDNLVEGPIIDTEREDAVADQDDVDDLLSSLGF